MLELIWHHGTPKEVGTYFVAAEYGPGTGMFEMMDWNGEKWDCYSTIKIVAYLSWSDFKQQLDLKWPGELPVMPPRQALSESEMDYTEV